MFDGKCAHEVSPYSGERCSVMLYTAHEQNNDKHPWGTNTMNFKHKDTARLVYVCVVAAEQAPNCVMQ